jgi:serine/threonine-protein kinase
MEPTAAETALRNVGLIGAVGDSVFDAEVPVNAVAQQTPGAGTIAKEGETVTYHLSKGVENVEVPTVVGVDATTAQQELEAQGFVVEVTYEANAVYDAGYVTQQSLTGEAQKGSTVTIVVSTGPNKVQVPSVVGYDYATASSILQQSGFGVSLAYSESSTVDNGIVMDQSIAGQADEGSTVTITVSIGSSTPQSSTDSSSTASDSTSSSASNEQSNSTQQPSE